MALTRPRFKQDIDLLIEALQLAAGAASRGAVAVGLLGDAALAIALGSSRN